MTRRAALETLKQLCLEKPVVIVTGPRKSGKTTLVRAAFPDKPYISFDSHSVFETARKDLSKFIALYKDGAVIDDAHRCPELINHILGNLGPDADKGAFIVISPIHFDHLAPLQTLNSEKVALLRLLPFSYPEARDVKGRTTLFDLMFHGSYPPVCSGGVDPQAWFSEYVMNFVERDLRHLVNVRDLGAFSSFIRVCALHMGYLVNQSELAYECGITHNTAKAWLAAMEASQIIFLLYPHPATFGRRTVKSPKLYFYDAGLAAFLLGIREPGKMPSHFSWPFLFETFIISELVKTRFNSALQSNLYYWCDGVGNEIQVIVERGEALIPVRIRPTHALAEKDADFLAKWRRLNGQPSLPAGIVYCGNEQALLNGITVYPWHEIGEIGPRFCGSKKAFSRK
jgi:predicted AAA+ superfamily ATPase